jgi:GT2 family glycosyltransferase
MRFATLPDDPSGGRNASMKRNYGVQLAHGDWIAFTDDDCIATPAWLAAAATLFGAAGIGGIEGRKVIPKIEPPTATYRGLLLMTAPQGYQTCNMLYRRHEFVRLGGFDTAFPFYLEDTDLAWTFLDAGLALPFASDAVVEHPVVPPAPWRLWVDAKRPVQLPYLFKKHPDAYRTSRIRPLRRASLAYLTAEGVFVTTLLSGQLQAALWISACLLGLTVAHALKIFRGCRVGVHEVAVTVLLLPIIPPVSLAQFLRGCARQRVWPAVL